MCVCVGESCARVVCVCICTCVGGVSGVCVVHVYDKKHLC